ncbi:MAG: hypothetical protein LBK82_05205 [Planctomycetaceae bacterium]|jgi:hypothetical protein|nr:hypothetical protein [Planctomycetaceae bacterium]
MPLTPISQDAVDLLLQGALCLSEVEINGIRIDVPYLKQTMAQVQSDIVELEKQMKLSKEWSVWKRMHKDKAKITSRHQLGTVLFKNIKNVKDGNLGYTCRIYTEHGAPEVSEVSLQDIELPFVKDYVQYMSLQKVLNTSLKGIADEVDSNGILHPFFNLNTVQTYRSSCVAKGTLIMVFRKGNKNPIEVPIEEIKKGDYVLCFDNKLKLTSRSVLWAGKTGHKKVIRIGFYFFSQHGGTYRYIDLTPEHKIRTANGIYVKAINFFKPENKRKSRKILALNPYGHGQENETVIYDYHVLKKEVDVYDIQVEEFHNFIANEICVHNSDSPSFQNFPVRNKKLSEIVRKYFIARPGNHFVEVDYSSVEVRCNSCINKDPKLIQYVTDPNSDMHRDMSVQIFKLSPERVSKPIRNISKGGFNFAAFYGSWWKGLAEGIWDQARVQNPETTDGVPLMTHLQSVKLGKLGTINEEGIPNPGSFYEHIKNIEADF